MEGAQEEEAEKHVRGVGVVGLVKVGEVEGHEMGVVAEEHAREVGAGNHVRLMGVVQGEEEVAVSFEEGAGESQPVREVEVVGSFWTPLGSWEGQGVQVFLPLGGQEVLDALFHLVLLG